MLLVTLAVATTFQTRKYPFPVFSVLSTPFSLLSSLGAFALRFESIYEFVDPCEDDLIRLQKDMCEFVKPLIAINRRDPVMRGLLIARL